MNIKRHIDTRNLVVCDTFDEFAEKVKQCDENVEDIVGYVTSVSRVFYWLNVESVWGVLGFTWEPSSLETLEGVPYLEEKLEHVEESGVIIDYDNKSAEWKQARAVKKGYGHFNASTIPFTIIPKLPDGYRITKLIDTFNLIESEYIEVQKSDWSNLTEIRNLITPTKSIKIDLTGANIHFTDTDRVFINNQDIRHNLDGWTHTIYIKGDLSNLENGTFERHYYDYVIEYGHHTLLLDDDNKGLNFPTTITTENIFYYTDTEKEFDVRDWLLINSNPTTNVIISLLAESGKYYINNALMNNFIAGNSRIKLFSMACLTNKRPKTFNGYGFKITDPIHQEVKPLEIRTDCNGSDGNTREDILVQLNGTWYYKDEQDNSVYPYDIQCNLPIKYEGSVNSITMWNPYCLVKNDDDWPEYNQAMVDKLTKFDGYTQDVPGVNIYGRNQGYFMYGAYLYITKPSPYTIDCTNIRYLNLFERAHFIISDYSNFEVLSDGSKCLEIVKITNANNLVSFIAGWVNTQFWFKIPSIKTVFFGDANTFRDVRFYIPEGKVVEAAYFQRMWYSRIKFGKSSVTAFKVRHIDCKALYNADYTARFDFTAYSPVVNDNIYDFIELEDGITNDTDFLKGSIANTTWGFFGNNRTIRHPFIVVNTNLEISGIATNWSIESSFVFIYKANITISNSTAYNSDRTTAAYNAFEKILPGIQVNDTTNTYTIKLKKPVFDLLTTAEKNYIINDLNYTLAYDL